MQKAFLALVVLLITASPLQAAEGVCKITKVVMHVDGMVCDFCTRSVEAEMRKDPAISDVTIDLDAKTVTLWIPAGTKNTQIDDKTLLGKIDYAGYKTTGIDRSCAE